MKFDIVLPVTNRKAKNEEEKKCLLHEKVKGKSTHQNKGLLNHYPNHYGQIMLYPIIYKQLSFAFMETQDIRVRFCTYKWHLAKPDMSFMLSSSCTRSLTKLSYVYDIEFQSQYQK